MLLFSPKETLDKLGQETIFGQFQAPAKQKSRKIAGLRLNLVTGFYAFLRLLNPTRPSSAVANSQTAAGTGIGGTGVSRSAPDVSVILVPIIEP